MRSPGFRVIRPDDGFAAPMSNRSNVVLPEPLGPTTVTISPGSSASETSRNTLFAP